MSSPAHGSRLGSSVVIDSHLELRYIRVLSNGTGPFESEKWGLGGAGRKMENFEVLENADFEKLKFRVMPFSWWVKSSARICFSYGAVKDADRRWLAECVKEDVTPGAFVFYIPHGSELSGAGCAEILERLQLSNLRPDVRLIKPAQ